MMSVRRWCVIVIALLSVVAALLYVEHPSVQFLKAGFVKIGAVDSVKTIVGITDIRSTDHTRGEADADIVLIEYSDYSCLLCAAMREVFSRMLREEKIQLVYRHLYQNFSGEAYKRAIAAECVAKHAGEEAFDLFNEYVYANQYQITEADITTKAIQLNIPAQEFDSCIRNDEAVREHIERDSREGWKLGARGTPYIVVVYKGFPVGISYANEYQAFVDRVFSLVAEKA